jgi:hypothetical protein
MNSDKRLISWREFQRRKRILQTATGLCRIPGCKEKPTEGFKTCSIHRVRMTALGKKWAKTPKGKAHRKQYRQNVRRRVVEGHHCACCGESDWRFLTIDHKIPVGRKKTRIPSTSLYQWLYQHGIPDYLQVYCYNCNCAKGEGDHCPHEDELRSILKA